MTYRHLRDPGRWTVTEVLAAQAEAHGEDPFLITTDGDVLTYAAAQDQAARVGAFLRSVGIGRGDGLAVILPNSLDFVRVWLGAAHVGATFVPLNPALTGDFLAHQLRVSGASVAVVDADLLTNLEAVAGEIGQPPTALVVGEPKNPTQLRVRRFSEWSGASPGQPAHTCARDTACVMFTSGTTGPSKGVVMPHAHCYLLGLGSVDNLAVTSSDRYYIAMPLYHANALFMQLYATLIAGGSAVLRNRFSASEWLPDMRRHGCTVTNLLGAMSQFIIDQPDQPTDREHRVRVVLPAPNPAHHEDAWRTRFGIAEVVSAYGMTEANIPLYGRLGESRPGTAGFAYSRYFEVEIHDPDSDEPVAPGVPGEICVRSKVPYGFSGGYLGMPAETVTAVRNFWFHTGDLGVMDEHGCVTFVDRHKDCIRRRGENISSFEVEQAMAKHPQVKEVAAFPVPSTPVGTEDEVMLAVVPHGPDLTETDLAAYADSILPRFARPRYIELVTDLPKTPTERVRKAVLRERGITAATWDRDNPVRSTETAQRLEPIPANSEVPA